MRSLFPAYIALYSLFPLSNLLVPLSSSPSIPPLPPPFSPTPLRYHPRVHTFEDGKPAVVLDPVVIQELEQNVYDSYQYYRKSKGYI